ncbi:type II toxin-antitoxin system ParD family antitoxin [uncultured Rhodospira sp.]|uniref:ribbon-helix-helix domain-containing protein n=1 Tax=uncultured Rhodospira sp. TaxID=1936189 RepID=UPI00263979FE|nr:type II toxin-antitoxin system ParD family antitoxin [uncultured Rhodospira sp.]
MSRLTVSLSEDLTAFVGEQMTERGYESGSDSVHDLIRKERDRQRLRGLLLAGAASEPDTPADAAWFEALRDRIRGHAGQ